MNAVEGGGSGSKSSRAEGDEQKADVPSRQTICFPHHGTQGVLQHGDTGFSKETSRLYSDSESKVLEDLIALKTTLSQATDDDFFSIVTEGMSKMLGAEICFVMKRVLIDDQHTAVEMPPLGEPGSCLMAAALHYCTSTDGTGSRNTVTSTKYAAWDCPCAYMKHDKIFLIPDRLGEFITKNPNTLPYPCESYMALPLKSEGKCFAHFGAMWSPEAARARKLRWATVELIMHSLEDMILARLLKGPSFVKESTKVLDRSRIIPHEAVSAAQSLRPYAGSLSHELRTPMQGVVGMLDVMYATVQEAGGSQMDPSLQRVFATLKENIEAVQDSSRRVVEAADNVVHAYDMDMSVPDGPVELLDDSIDSAVPISAVSEKRPKILVAGSDLPLTRPNKRRREDYASRSMDAQGSNKVPKLMRSASTCQCSESKRSSMSDGIPTEVSSAWDLKGALNVDNLPPKLAIPHTSSRTIAPGLRHSDLRELIQHIIDESLKVGGRPDSAVAVETAQGAEIEVRVRKSDGTIGTKIIEWSVDDNVPDTLFIDEMDLSKLISRVFLNAIKFTDTLAARIRIHARMSNRGRYISIKITDNGPGIPEAFLPRLFKAFSQEDPSLTRSSEGLGLGLMVAKGIARKLGGDLTCNRTETEGPDRGTQFEIKVPLHAGETLSRPSSPFGSPHPQKAQLASIDQFENLPATSLPTSAAHYKWTKALQETVGHDSNDAVLPPKQRSAMLTVPSTPPSPRSLDDEVENVHALPPPTSDAIAAPTLPSSPPLEAIKPLKFFSQTKRETGASKNIDFDRDLAKKYPLNFLVAEDNKINRKLLVSMLGKFGYKNVLEAHDGTEAVRQMAHSLLHPDDSTNGPVDVILMDLWMPLMDGYEATERILSMDVFAATGQSQLHSSNRLSPPTVLAVTADVTDGALERAARAGMKGFMSKPYKLIDLQRLIIEYCSSHKMSNVSGMKSDTEGTHQTTHGEVQDAAIGAAA
jgi:signal transduction histidine kinase/CheY-like chemotaxis protein